MSKTLYAEFTVKPGSEARVAEMMLELTRKVRQEPGNVIPSLHGGGEPQGLLCLRGLS